MSTEAPPAYLSSSTSASTAGLAGAGAVTALLGLAALLGWALHVPSLSNMGSGLIPMAPSTALLFLLNGLALGLRARPTLDGRSRMISAAATSLSAMIALVLLVLGLYDVHPAVEHLGISITGEIRGAPLGHMSPATAACFLLAGLSSIASLARSSVRHWPHTMAVGSAGLLLGASLVFLLAYLYGKPLLYGGPIIPPAINTALAFAVLATGLLILAGRRPTSSHDWPDHERVRGPFVAVAVVLAAMIVATGYYYYQRHERQFRSEVESQLSSIAELKVGELMQWRKERFGDGTIFFENGTFATRVRRYLEAPDDSQHALALHNWLRQLQAGSQYDRVSVMNPRGAEMMSVPTTPEPVAQHLAASVSESLRSRQMSMLDFHRDGPGRPTRLAVLVPIFDVETDSRPLGVLVLSIDPSQYLYPFIQRWPIPTRSAETLLVRREGNDALFLNELRFRQGAALELRRSLQHTSMPAVMAALGHEGIVEGVDYRGVPVIAALRAVPDSPWFLVARMDIEEAVAPLSERLWELALMVAALLVGSGAGLGLLWRLQSVHFYRERYHAAEALRTSEARVKAIYDHMPYPTFVWTRQADDFVLTACNDAARTASKGYVAGLIGLTAATIPYRFPELGEDLDRCYRQREPVRREVDYTSPIFESLRRVVTTYGFIPPDMVLLLAEDVTDLRRTEEHLRGAQRMEAIGRLAGGVAHDFNNLLSVILSYADFAMEAVQKNDPLHADLSEIRKAGERAASLTSQLLAFSRRQLLQPQVVNLNKIVGAMEGMLRRVLHEDIELAMTLATDLGNVTADSGQIEQVVLNLAVNARDAMPDGGRLAIDTANVELDEDYAIHHAAVKPGPHVMLSVTDTGSGMDRQTQARIFEPFFTTKTAGKGTGLGLATVYGIVKQSGGSIWVYSETGQGTTFKVYLPRELTAAETSARPAQLPTRSVGTETIMVVEDEEAVRILATRILRAAGYTVLSAANGAEALLVCERSPASIHLVLTDVVMPQMSGMQLVERLAKVCPGVRVLFMSGYTDNAVVHHGILELGTHFVTKPFNAPDLTRAVRMVLDEKPRT